MTILNAAQKAAVSRSRKKYFRDCRKIAKLQHLEFREARELYVAARSNGTLAALLAGDDATALRSPRPNMNGEAHATNGPSESQVQRKLKAARALIAECGGDVRAAAEFMEILEALE